MPRVAPLLLSMLLMLCLALQGVAASAVAPCRHGDVARAPAMAESGDPHAGHRMHATARSDNAEADAGPTTAAERGCDCGGDCAMAGCAGSAAALPSMRWLPGQPLVGSPLAARDANPQPHDAYGQVPLRPPSQA